MWACIRRDQIKRRFIDVGFAALNVRMLATPLYYVQSFLYRSYGSMTLKFKSIANVKKHLITLYKYSVGMMSMQFIHRAKYCKKVLFKVQANTV